MCKLLGEDCTIPNEDCCQVFVNTFSANKSIIADANFQPAPEPEEYMPMKIKPVVEEAEGEGDAEEKEEEKQKKPKRKLDFGKLVAKATEYNKGLSKGNKIPRAMEFSRQCETVFLKHFGFRYLTSDRILGKP